MNPHILLVDDHRGLRDGLQFILESEGYRVTTAADGARALEAVSTEQPDLVLADLDMPVMAGDELLRRLRAALPALPVVIMSGAVRGAAAAKRAGADAYLAKPFCVGTMLSSLRQLLHGGGRTPDADSGVLP